MVIEFFVDGIARPQGSKKHVGGGRMVEMSKDLRPWREAIVASAELTAARGGWETATGPIGVIVTFYLPRPASHPKTRRTWPVSRRYGDTDKLQRALGDSLESAGVVANDSQIVEWHASKAYVHPEHLRFPGEPDRPGAHVKVHRMDVIL